MKVNSININSNYKYNTSRSQSNIKKQETCDTVSFRGDSERERSKSSALPWFFSIFAKLNNSEVSDTKDGVIQPTKQGNLGDCWLLSSVNALSYCRKGADIIKETFHYTKNGTIVNLRGAKSYYISDNELEKTRYSSIYAKGDDDMVLLELAIQRARDDLASQKLIFDGDVSKKIQQEFGKKTTSMFKPSIEAGFELEAMYYITGKVPELIKDEDARRRFMYKYWLDNGSNYALCTAFKGNDKMATDVNGRSIRLYSRHSYAVKKTDNRTVTIINPHNSAKEIVLPKEEFISKFDELYALDCSVYNREKRVVSPTLKKTERHEDGSYAENTLRSDRSVYRRDEYDAKGTLKKTIFYNENNLEEEIIKYTSFGKVISRIRNDYYDNKRLKKEEKIYYNKGVKTSSYISSYNRYGGREFNSRIRYEKGVKAEEFINYYDSFDNFKYAEKITYDKNGHEISRKKLTREEL
ncbi:hypothetical protein II906_06805 [bacterium]|nr:hypothetical protein [bacterium]